jgi:hypothetical protein
MGKAQETDLTCISHLCPSHTVEVACQGKQSQLGGVCRGSPAHAALQVEPVERLPANPLHPCRPRELRTKPSWARVAAKVNLV